MSTPPADFLPMLRAACQAFVRMDRALRQGQQALQMRHMRMLMAIGSAPAEGHSTRRLAERLNLSPQDVSVYLKFLEDRDLIYRDQRRVERGRLLVIPRLTPAALELLSAAFDSKKGASS